jgi:hypothetical protein
VRLLLEHGVEPELHGTRRPFYDGRTWKSPARTTRTSSSCSETPARHQGRDELHEFLMACTTPDRARVERLLAQTPRWRSGRFARYPDQLVRAAETDSLEAVAILIDLGFDVNAIRAAPLHEAAMRATFRSSTPPRARRRPSISATAPMTPTPAG